MATEFIYPIPISKISTLGGKNRNKINSLMTYQLLYLLTRVFIFFCHGSFKDILFKFDVHRAMHRNIISTVKPTRCTKVSNLFYFGMTLYMFRTVFPSIIRSSRLYIQQQPFVKQILLSAC